MTYVLHGPIGQGSVEIDETTANELMATYERVLGYWKFIRLFDHVYENYRRFDSHVHSVAFEAAADRTVEWADFVGRLDVGGVLITNVLGSCRSMLDMAPKALKRAAGTKSIAQEFRSSIKKSWDGSLDYVVCYALRNIAQHLDLAAQSLSTVSERRKEDNVLVYSAHWTVPKKWLLEHSPGGLESTCVCETCADDVKIGPGKKKAEGKSARERIEEECGDVLDLNSMLRGFVSDLAELSHEYERKLATLLTEPVGVARSKIQECIDSTKVKSPQQVRLSNEAIETPVGASLHLFEHGQRLARKNRAVRLLRHAEIVGVPGVAREL